MIDETLDEYRNYYNSIKNIRVLKPEEEIALFMRYEKGDKKARDLIITHNLRLVSTIVIELNNSKSISRMDLIQQGNLELFRAIDCFNYKLGNRFSTYATKFIRDSLLNYIKDHSTAIKIPKSSYALYKKIKESELKLEQKLERKPTIKEISEDTNILEKTIVDVLNKFLSVISIESKVYNVDTSDNNDSDYKLKDIIPDNFSLDDEISKDEILCFGNKCFKNCYELFNHLNFSNQEKEILALRYGLINGECKTLEYIANTLNLSKEGVRQIEAKCLAKIRRCLGVKLNECRNAFSPVFIKRLQEFYECTDYNKFFLDYNYCYFNNGISMNKWWYRNNYVIFNSDNDLCKKIIKQYNNFIINHSNSNIKPIKRYKKK